jgi:hypothetical protein
VKRRDGGGKAWGGEVEMTTRIRTTMVPTPILTMTTIATMAATTRAHPTPI